MHAPDRVEHVDDLKSVFAHEKHDVAEPVAVFVALLDRDLGKDKFAALEGFDAALQHFQFKSLSIDLKADGAEMFCDDVVHGPNFNVNTFSSVPALTSARKAGVQGR